MSDTHVMWVAKGAGAIAGSAISLAYLLPSGRREAALPGLSAGFSQLSVIDAEGRAARVTVRLD